MALTYTEGGNKNARTPTNPLGGGRPKGSTNKLTVEGILRSIDKTCGRPFEELLAEGYHRTIIEDNQKLRFEYERMFLGKVVADRINVDVNESQEAIEAKKAAFAEAVAHLSGIAKEPPLVIEAK